MENTFLFDLCNYWVFEKESICFFKKSEGFCEIKQDIITGIIDLKCQTKKEDLLSVVLLRVKF